MLDEVVSVPKRRLLWLIPTLRLTLTPNLTLNLTLILTLNLTLILTLTRTRDLRLNSILMIPCAIRRTFL